jgi:SAM-dependent methyltransferase
MSVAFTHPAIGEPLRLMDNAWVADSGARFPIVAGVPRFCEPDNYTSSFGRQWNLFEKTQIDGEGIASSPSAARLFAETGWSPQALDGLDVLEVGSGAGRFSRVILERTRANLYSIDYSTAVEANWRNNAALGAGRFVLAQASIYDMPFPDDSFDKVLCLGVLQHTPDFEASVRALARKARKGGEIVVDFYPIRGWWTKIHAKYLLRPITRRMSHDTLLRLIDRNADRLIAASRFLDRAGLGAMRRFLPVVDITDTLPAGLSRAQLREWVVLDTFDMFSPEHDHPQRIPDVARIFERAGAEVTFAGEVDCGTGKAAVVRAIRR